MSRSTHPSESLRFRPSGPTESAPEAPSPNFLCLIPLQIDHEFGPGSALISQILLATTANPLHDGDILVIASKIIAKCEGQLVPIREGQRVGHNELPLTMLPTREELVTRDTRRIIARRSTSGQGIDGKHGETRVVEAFNGQVMAAAGIDSSNVPAGTALLLPRDCDASARRLRDAIYQSCKINIGVIISDTNGRPWRVGVSDVALGVAGFDALDDHRGQPDDHGRLMQVTLRNLADEIACSADLVKAKATRTPIAIARGVGCPELLAPGVDTVLAGRELNRTGVDDWFAFGHVEAIRASLGVDPLAAEPPPLVPDHDSQNQKWQRALQVAAQGSGAAATAFWQISPLQNGTLTLTCASSPTPAEFILLGKLLQRIESACFAENVPTLDVSWTTEPSPHTPKIRP